MISHTKKRVPMQTNETRQLENASFPTTPSPAKQEVTSGFGEKKYCIQIMD